ncbi:MAG: hypothetical protein ACFFAH_08145 [Promethearchaeota archaeon]
MLEILVWFFVIFIISYALWELLMRTRKKLGPFKHVINILAFVGVVIHELSHFIMCKILGVPTSRIRIKFLSETTGEANPHGYVAFKPSKVYFMQHVFISLAPLYISTLLFFWSLTVFFTPSYDDFIRVFAGFFCISLLLGAAPSSADLRLIKISFKEDPRYSLYQIGLLFMSGILIWFITKYYNIILPFDYIYYIIIGVVYFLLKYSFQGINKLLQSSTTGIPRIKRRAFLRRRSKPVKPYKLGIEEPHW